MESIGKGQNKVKNQQFIDMDSRRPRARQAAEMRDQRQAAQVRGGIYTQACRIENSRGQNG